MLGMNNDKRRVMRASQAAATTGPQPGMASMPRVVGRQKTRGILAQNIHWVI
jgi:hypothetical protein